MDRSRIGEGQKVSASYVIPVGGSNIEPGTIFWNCDGYQILNKATEKNGVSTINFVANYKVGEHEIEFTRQYINFDLAETQTRSIKGKFTIVDCDILSSFWGDSRALVLATANEKFQEDTDPLTAIVRNAVISRDDELHQYFFNSDKLNKIVVLILPEVNIGQAVGSVSVKVKVLESQGFKRLSFDVIDLATGDKTPVDMNRLKDVAYTGPISTGVETGKLELKATFETAKTNAVLSFKMGEVGMLVKSITYTPR